VLYSYAGFQVITKRTRRVNVKICKINEESLIFFHCFTFVIHNHYLSLTRLLLDEQKIETSCDTNDKLIIASFTDNQYGFTMVKREKFR
jgi:hypothetical protein